MTSSSSFSPVHSSSFFCSRTISQFLNTLTATAQILVVLASLAVGFKLGARRWATSDTALEGPAEVSKQLQEQETLDDNEEENVEDVADGDFSAVQAKHWEPCKLVLVVRTDLKLSPGDISTQCANATLACYKALVSKNPQLVRHWEVTGQAKIALKGTSDDQLLELEAIAKSLNLCARAVHDESLTKNAEGSQTVLGIGPAPVEFINQVTGKLRLL
ncbi:peptidyl-tRNA hydrolase PTH2-domain-containing protein [Phellopilus nigrolimitatus]|nr:peptidyl-tRNA hydrolase PTH2-domain-containing protein [Phellopilus nigrolimitatus]